MDIEAYDLIVIGGGPAGSTASAIAARAGLRVLLLEAQSHPRVHVGESLLPGIIPILEEMGALADVEAAGFQPKTGSTHWGWGRTPSWDLWFSDSEAYDQAWMVERGRFDEILFRAAARAGAEALEQAAVTELCWEGDRLTGVVWRARGDAAHRRATAPLTLDASGHTALLARKLGLREPICGLEHEASWAHYEGAGRLPAPRAQQALFSATSSHWIWCFPLSPTLTSVGIIRLRDDGASSEEGRASAFDETVARSAEITGVLGPAARRVTPVRNVRDWSYRMKRVTGPGWMLVGDASGFIDPVLSTGVILAMHAGYHAGKLALEIARGRSTEADARARYEAQHAAMFSDLLRIVRYFYQQNLHRDDYFWESKRILAETIAEVRPQKAFMVLTSGLVHNLAFEQKAIDAHARRADSALAEGRPERDGLDPDTLRFVCLHLRLSHGDEKVALYFLIEPIDPASPSLFRTINWHLNCLAPRFQNDPIKVPEVAPHLRALEQKVRALDTVPGEPLVAFWRRARAELVRTAQTLSASIEVARVFGE